MSEDFIIPYKQLCLCSAAALSLFLGGCSNDFGPFSMPSGYAHHNKEYKAPPGAELLSVPEEKTEGQDMAAMPPEDVEEDPLAGMDFSTKPEDYVHEAPVSRPDPIENKPEDLLQKSAGPSVEIQASASVMPLAEPAVTLDSPMKKTDSGVVVGASEDYEINAYESYVEKTYVYDKSYEERRLREAAARATQVERAMAPSKEDIEEAGAVQDASYDLPPSGAITPDTDMAQAAQDLLDRLTAEFGKPAEPVYLAPLKNSDNEAFRTALWVAMEKEGMTVTDKAGRGPFVMKYGIMPAAGEKNMARVSLTMMSGKTLVAQVSENYPMAMNNDVPPDDMAPIGEAAPPPAPAVPSYDSGISYPLEDRVSEPVSLFEP